MLDQEKRRRLISEGWQFKASGQCKAQGCIARVEYWQRGKEVSIRDFIGMAPHWITCAGKKKKQGAKSPKQIEMFPAAK